MKKTKINKFLVIGLTLFSLLLCFVGCKQEQDDKKIDEDINIDNVNYTIESIDELGNITLRKKSDVEFAKELYDSLNDKEKEKVENYEVLVAAINKINYLEHEDEYIKIGYDECIEYLDSFIPSSINDGIYSIDLPKKYEYKNDYNEYVFLLDWSSSDSRILNSNGYVYHMSSDKNVDITCEISNLIIQEKAFYSKTISIERKPEAMISKPLITSYFYGTYTGLNSIDVNTIDILNYSFAQIAKRQEGSKTVYYIDCSGVSSIDKISELHEYGVKVCLSLGGWHDDASFWQTYKDAASTDENRKMVANAILDTMEKYQLDGVDLDWEYPGSGDKNNFTLLMQEISKTLKEKDSNYIISAAVPCGSWSGQRYDYKALNSCMDYFYVMTYDLDLDGSTVTKHLSDLSSCKAGAKVLIDAGVDKEKVVFGCAFYGRIFNNVSSTNNGLGQTFESKSSINFTKIYSDYLNRVGTDCTIYYDSNALAYYLYDSKNNCMISYDSPESLKDKYKAAIDMDIGGIMYWSYNNDNTGILMNALYEAKEEYNNSNK